MSTPQFHREPGYALELEVKRERKPVPPLLEDSCRVAGGLLWEQRSEVAGKWGRVHPEPRASGRRPGGGSPPGVPHSLKCRQEIFLSILFLSAQQQFKLIKCNNKLILNGLE